MREEARRLSQLLREAADDLDWYDTKFKVVRGVALTTAVIGGGLAVAGAFVTNGATLPLAYTGYEVAAAAVCVAGGAGVVKHVTEWKKYRQMTKLWEALRGEKKRTIDPQISASTILSQTFKLWLDFKKRPTALELPDMRMTLLASFTLSLVNFVSLINDVSQGKGSDIACLLRDYADLLDEQYP